MAIRRAPLAIQFAGGVETRLDSKQVPTTRLLDLQNAVFTKQTTLSKRNGYLALGRAVDATGAFVIGPQGLARRDNELLEFAGDRCYSYRPSSDEWSDAGAVSAWVASDVPIARTGTQQSVPDVANNEGVTVAAWEDSRGGVWCEVLETNGYRVLLAPTQLDANGQRPRCVPCGTVLHVYWARPATGQLMCARINPVTASMPPAQSILASDLSTTNPAFDAVTTYTLVSAERPSLIGWCTAFGGFRIGYVHGSGALGSPLYGLPSVATNAATPLGPIAVAASQLIGGATWVAAAWATSAGSSVVNAAVYPTALTAPTTATQSVGGDVVRLAAEFGALGATTEQDLFVSAEISGASSDLARVSTVRLQTNGVSAGVVGVIRGHGLLSRAFYDNGHIYAAVVHSVKFFPYVAIARVSTAGNERTPVAARLLPGFTPGLPARQHVASVMAGDDFASRVHEVPLLKRLQLDSSTGLEFGEVGILVARLESNRAGAWQTAQLGRGLYLGAASLQHYDGDRWAEADFHTAPDVAGSIVTFQALGGSLTVGGLYLYQIVFEEIDGQGEIHPGACSAPVTVALTSTNQKVTINVPTCRLTSKRRVRIGVFRAAVNATGALEEIPFFRVTSTDPTATGDNGYVLNDPTVDTVAFTDGMSDATLITKEGLYTNGGLLPNDPAAVAGGVIAGGKSRLFLTDPSDPQLVRYTQEIRDDTAAELPIDLSMRVDPYGGDVVAAAIMDGAVYVLCETSIYVFGGPGPGRDGGTLTQDAFSPPELVTSDVGCVSPGSVVTTPVGIMFQSTKGIRMLDRSRQIIPIGNPVDAYRTQTFVRATLLPDRPHIVFLTDSGSTLLFDYERGQWSRFTNHEGLDAIVVDGAYYYLRPDGRVFRETPGVYRDDNQQIRMVIETAWIHFAEYLQGWQKVLWAYFLGKYLSPHTLQVKYRLDYNEGYSPPINSNVDANYNPSEYGDGGYGDGYYGGPFGGGTRYQRRIHLNRRCQAISFVIEDVEVADDFGASFELSELLIIGGGIGPDFKVGAARSA